GVTGFRLVWVVSAPGGGEGGDGREERSRPPFPGGGRQPGSATASRPGLPATRREASPPASRAGDPRQARKAPQRERASFFPSIRQKRRGANPSQGSPRDISRSQ